MNNESYPHPLKNKKEKVDVITLFLSIIGHVNFAIVKKLDTILSFI